MNMRKHMPLNQKTEEDEKNLAEEMKTQLEKSKSTS